MNNISLHFSNINSPPVYSTIRFNNNVILFSRDFLNNEIGGAIHNNKYACQCFKTIARRLKMKFNITHYE